jgi:membrane protein implicated in regulation of membrane protease activity
MSSAALLRQRLVALFALALALLNFPLLALWDHEALVAGLPLFPTALFVLWAALIGLLAWLLERGPDDATGTEADADLPQPPRREG